MRRCDYDKLTGRCASTLIAFVPAARSVAAQTGKLMIHTSIDIDAVPQIDTAVGLFGSFAGETAINSPGVFEVAVTVVMIVYD